jgi:hypothetical protein
MPWIKTGREEAPPGQHSGSVPLHPCYALWAAQVKLRDYSFLSSLRLGWSTKDQQQEAGERRLQFVNCIHDQAINFFSEGERLYALRVIQRENTSVLEFIFMVKTLHSTQENAIREAEEAWFDIQGNFPVDYILEPIQNKNFYEKTGLNWTNDFEQATVHLIHQSIEFPYANTEKPQPIQLCGHWAKMIICQDQVWRALHHAPVPIFLDVLMQPTILAPIEVATLDEMTNKLLDFTNEDLNNGIMKVWASKRLELLQQHNADLIQPYLLQVRILSPNQTPSYVDRVIGSSLSSLPDGASLINRGWHSIYPLNINDLINWKNKVSKMAFIEFAYPANIPLRLPYLATAKEIVTAFCLPLLPEGGIPDLNIDST